jgi:hypothetical protein
VAGCAGDGSAAAGGCGALQGAAWAGWPGMRGGKPGRVPLRWDMISGVTPEPGVYVAAMGGTAPRRLHGTRPTDNARSIRGERGAGTPIDMAS